MVQKKIIPGSTPIQKLGCSEKLLGICKKLNIAYVQDLFELTKRDDISPNTLTELNELFKDTIVENVPAPKLSTPVSLPPIPTIAKAHNHEPSKEETQKLSNFERNKEKRYEKQLRRYINELEYAAKKGDSRRIQQIMESVDPDYMEDVLKTIYGKAGIDVYKTTEDQVQFFEYDGESYGYHCGKYYAVTVRSNRTELVELSKDRIPQLSKSKRAQIEGAQSNNNPV